MTLGQQYIINAGIQELSYKEAIQQAYKELNEMGIEYGTQIYDNDDVIDNPIYPANAELYDEFVDDFGFDVVEFLLFVCRYMNA